jgi:hypothetical protein
MKRNGNTCKEITYYSNITTYLRFVRDLSETCNVEKYDSHGSFAHLKVNLLSWFSIMSSNIFTFSRIHEKQTYIRFCLLLNKNYLVALRLRLQEILDLFVILQTTYKNVANIHPFFPGCDLASWKWRKSEWIIINQGTRIYTAGASFVSF